METILVKDLMVPVAEYATVPQTANLFDVVLALEDSHTAIDPSRHKHRAVLVLDEQKQVVGKLSMIAILKALEPKYGKLEAKGTLSRSGHSPDLIESIFQSYFLWNETLDLVCSRAPNIKVRDLIGLPEESGYIEETDDLAKSIHKLVVAEYASLLVKRGDHVVGILRLSDVFLKICKRIKSCGDGLEKN
mgnify:CR=1 FL=1